MMSTKKLLQKAQRNLYRVVEDPRFWTPAFCRTFFDWCDEQAYESPDTALLRGDLAVTLSKKTRDRHSCARAHGVMASAYRINTLYDRADTEFEQAFRLAGTCSCCLSDLYRRQGALRLHQESFGVSLELLGQAITHYEAIGDADGVGRTFVSQGIALCLTGKIDEALEVERKALTLLAVDTPKIYYLGALANIVGTLAYGTNDHCTRALHYLDWLEKRLQGVPKITAVRTRLSWSKGLILARLGERKRGIQMLRNARAALLRARQDNEYIAISADIARLYCDTEKYYLIVTLMQECLDRLSNLLGTKTLLEHVLFLAERHFSETREATIRLRDSVAASIPSLLDEKTPQEAFSSI